MGCFAMRRKNKGRTRKFNSNPQVYDFEEISAKRDERRKELKKKKFEKFEKFKRKNKNKSVVVKSEARKKAIRKRRIQILLVVVIVAIVLTYFGSRILTITNEKKELLKKQEQLTEQKAELENQVENMESLDYVEQQARKKLHLVMPGEILYVLPEDEEAEKEAKEEKEELLSGDESSNIIKETLGIIKEEPPVSSEKD